MVDVELTIPHDTGWNTIWTLTVVLFIQFLHKLYSVCARVFVCVRVCGCVYVAVQRHLVLYMTERQHDLSDFE